MKACYPEHLGKTERRIIDLMIRDTLDAGFAIRIYDGEEFAEETPTPTRDYVFITKAIAATDETTVMIYAIDQLQLSRLGSVELIHGNDDDVIHDHSTSLDAHNILVRAKAQADDGYVKSEDLMGLDIDQLTEQAESFCTRTELPHKDMAELLLDLRERGARFMGTLGPNADFDAALEWVTRFNEAWEAAEDAITSSDAPEDNPTDPGDFAAFVAGITKAADFSPVKAKVMLKHIISTAQRITAEDTDDDVIF